jgi:hypothetical protein
MYNIITFVSSNLDKNPKWDKNNLAVLKSVQGWGGNISVALGEGSM